MLDFQLLEGYRLYKHVDTVIRKHTIRLFGTAGFWHKTMEIVPRQPFSNGHSTDFHRIIFWLDIHLLIHWLVVLKG